MKKLFLTALIFSPFGLIAQTIPNGNFENWNTQTFEEPFGWQTSNREAARRGGALNATKTTDVHGGTSAIKLVTMITGTDTSGAYVINSTSKNPEKGGGGVPYTSKPDSLTGYYKYTPTGNDSALVLFFFKTAGRLISANFYKLPGTGGNWMRFSRPVTYFLPLVPDSMIVGMAASNLIDNVGVGNGSTLIVDDLAFKSNIGTAAAIPNGDFESWTTMNAYVPIGWTPNGDPEGISRTIDSYKGSYALSLTTFAGEFGPNPSGVTTGTQDRNNGPRGGTPYTKMQDTLLGYYKFNDQGSNDTAVVQVNLSKNGNQIWGRSERLAAASTYTKFYIPINPGSAPDTIRIDIQSSDWFGTNAKVGNKLIIDEVQLLSEPLNTGIHIPFQNGAVKVYPNPSRRNIFIQVPENVNYTLTVTDLLGKEVFSGKASGNAELSLVSWNSGIYFYNLKTENRTLSGKIIKE